MKEMVPLLEKLAEKLGTTAEHLWSVLLKQVDIQLMKGIIGICFVELMLLSVIIIGIYGYKKKWNNFQDNVNPTILTMVISFFMIIAAIIFTVETIGLWLNPEYWALKQVFDCIGG